MRRVADGDRHAFEELYHLFARRLGGYLFKILRDPDLVEEALDDVMLVAWQKAASFDGSARVSTWLFGIAQRKAMKTLERSRRQRRDLDLSPELDPVARPGSPDDPEQSFAERDQLRQLARGIESLPPEQRAVLELTFFEGRSYAEISEVMDCPVNTVKTRMYHARRSLGRFVARDAAPGERGIDAAT